MSLLVQLQQDKKIACLFLASGGLATFCYQNFNPDAAAGKENDSKIFNPLPGTAQIQARSYAGVIAK